MANLVETSTATEPSMTALVSGIVADTQVLMRQELQLAKVEIKQELTKARDAAISLAAGTGFTVWGTVLLTFMVVHLLNWATPIPLWGCFGIVGGLIFITGAALIFFGKNRAESINLIPPQTAATMQENVQWIQNRR